MDYIESADEMKKAMIKHSPAADYIFMASAVADYLPKKVAYNKMKRSKKY